MSAFDDVFELLDRNGIEHPSIQKARAELKADKVKRDALLKALQDIKRTLAVGRNVGEDKDQAYQDAEELADAAIVIATYDDKYVPVANDNLPF